MKKLLVYSGLGVVAVFVLSFFISPSFHNLVSNQLASVINTNKVSVCPSGQGNAINGKELFPDELLIHVNKQNSLPGDYIPKNLVDISPKIKTTDVICVKSDLVDKLQAMFTDASKANVNLAVTSGFRSVEVQSAIYKFWIAVRGEKEKNRVAEPLYSEHQLGTTLDFTGASIGNVAANDTFEGTPEDLWLRKNAYKYGFVQSYPKGKTSVTGYEYEPWHYRYVGIKIAKEIFDKQISVEEYFDSLK